MKNWTIVIGTLTVLALGIGIRKAHAEHSENGCMKARAILLQDVELTAEQKALLQEFKAEKKQAGFSKEDRQQMHQEMKAQKHAWMVDYIAGNVSREEVLQKMADRSSKHEAHGANKQGMMLDLLSTYDDAQKAQVLENLDSQQSCFDDRREEIQEKHQKHQGRKGERMVSDLNLSASQQALWNQLQEDRKEKWAAFEDHEPGENLRDYLEGRITLDELEANQQDAINAKKSFHQEHVMKMMDFVDSLDQTQRDQFLQNITETKAHHQGKGPQ